MADDTAPTKDVVLERTLDAAPDLVWAMWTDPERFASWYGPTGATIPVARIDATVGGTRHVCMEMQTPNGPMRMWFVGEHREVEPPTRLVYTESMSNEAGEVLSAEEAGMPPGHPATTVVTVELEDLGGRTRLVLTHAGVPAGSPGETGWTMALDALGEALAGN